MTESEQMARVAEVQARVAYALVRLEAMKATNHKREAHGYAYAYDETAFEALIDEARIGSNAVIQTLRHD